MVKGLVTRGRNKKAGSEAAEAAAMMKFLGAKAENAAFMKSEKVMHLPEKKMGDTSRCRDATVDKDKENSGDNNSRRTFKDGDGAVVAAVAGKGERRKLEGEASARAEEADEVKKTNAEVVEEVRSDSEVRLLCGRVAVFEAVIGQISEKNKRIDRELKQMKVLRIDDRLKSEEQNSDLIILRNRIGELERKIEEGRERNAKLSKEVEEWVCQEKCVRREMRSHVEKRGGVGASESVRKSGTMRTVWE